MGGVEFEGTADPTDAEQWLERMERILEQLECSDVAKFKPDFGGPSKRGRFDDSKAGSVNRSPQQQQNKSEFSTASIPNYGKGKPRVPTCPQCGKNHYGTCRRASSSVHRPSNPPQTNRGARPKNTQAACASGANKASRPRATARAYAMRQRDDQDGQDVVVSKFHLFGFCVFTLFDPGSTHSYICSSLILPENVKSVRLNYDVLVESPLGYQDV
ncbi:uncharacterized protein LOC125859103 [Solanum stenotomum]|uniref:uncharacterized protein LOC125859103 n=1 Tax=Solanum stenotomum TaxID=172797 RepID=UPI0020D1C659|nr:uncharacterized protein LOC125859103 [Solanum stenotomum]